MRIAVIIAVLLTVFAISAKAQAPCPTGYVCYTQQTNNDILKKLNELIAARDLIATFTKERGTSDAALAKATLLVEAYQQLVTMRDGLDAKKDALIELQTQTIKLYADLVEKLQTQINKPKSAWEKFATALKEIAYVATGIIIGRAIP